MLFHKVNEIDSQEFFKMPKSLYTNSRYKDLSDGARCAYTIMLNRMSVSKKNNWCDEKGNIFIIYSVKDLANFMGKSERTISRYKKELEKHGLIYEIRQGLNRPNLIYVLKVEDDMSGQKGTKMSDTLSKNNKSNTNNNNNKDTNNLEDTTNDDETVDNESVVISDDDNSKEKESDAQESNNHEQTNKSEQEDSSEQEDNRFYTVDDVKRLFELAQQVSSSISVALIKNLLKHYSYKQIQEKLLYMQKFKQRNTIYNPNGFLVSALKDNYTFIDKAKAILDKANTAIQKTKEYLTQFTKDDDVADRKTSLNYLQSMKLQLKGAV